MNGTISIWRIIKLLVTYASQAGSTAGVAEAIGKSLFEGRRSGGCAAHAKCNGSDPLTRRWWLAVPSVGNSGFRKPCSLCAITRPSSRHKPFASFMVCITLSMANAGQYLEGLKGWMKPVRDLVLSGQRGLFCRGAGFLQAALLIQCAVDALGGSVRYLERRRPPGLECHSPLGGEPAPAAARVDFMCNGQTLLLGNPRLKVSWHRVLVGLV